MEQELKYKVAIIGAGPAGCICAYYLQDKFDVLVFEKNSPLKTLLPTGGGRCNLAHAEYDFKELAKNYPRGEKFLYSVFSKFSTADTIDFFEKIGVETYTQENFRIFPKSNSSKDVREKFLKALNKVHFIKEEALRINKLTSPHPSPKLGEGAVVGEDMSHTNAGELPISSETSPLLQHFLVGEGAVVGEDMRHTNAGELSISSETSPLLQHFLVGEGAVVGEDMSHTNAGELSISSETSPLLQHFLVGEGAVVGEDMSHTNAGEVTFSVVTNMNSYKADFVVIATGGHASYEIIKLLGHKIIDPKPALTGLKTKDDFSKLSGVSVNDILFTHKGVSGPKIYEISSLKARENFPYKLSFNLTGEIDLQNELNTNPHKSIKNLLGEHIPKSLCEYILKQLNIDINLKCHMIDGTTRDKILNKLQNFEITATGTVPDGEVVTSGGVDLNEINPKTLESKLIQNIYFCGEVLDIDGFCGGFNLQNCWSTGYIAADSIMRQLASSSSNPL